VKEEDMISKTASSIFGAGVMAVALAVSAPPSQAAIQFMNSTDQDLHFSVRCAGDSLVEQWVIDARSTGGLYCRNGVQVANLEIRTHRRDGRVMVVTATVRDPRTYIFDYDADGDVNLH
jgi:hypothetical protein